MREVTWLDLPPRPARATAWARTGKPAPVQFLEPALPPPDEDDPDDDGDGDDAA